MKSRKLEKGFSLLEVMIALTIFSVFITVYIAAQGYNISDSMNLKEEIKLKELCTRKINEIIVKPPQFREALTLTPEVNTFENDKDYEYRLTYKRLKIPDIQKLLGKEEGEEGGGEATESSQQGQTGVEAALMNKIKENMQEMIWQVEVQVVNKNSKATFTLTSWLMNNDAVIKNLDSI